MKRLVFLVLVLVSLAFAVVPIPEASAAHCTGADRYWVLGTGSNWTTSTWHWSASSGGPNGASVPGITNRVIFDANSGTGTATIDAAASVCDLLNTGSSTSAIQLNGQTLTVDGDMTDLSAEFPSAGGGTVVLSGSTTQTIGPAQAGNVVLPNIQITGTGTKVFNARIVWSGAWTQTASATVQIGTGFSNAGLFASSDAGGSVCCQVIRPDAGITLTFRSTTAGTRATISLGGGTLSFYRTAIQDITVSDTTTDDIFATDATNTDLGNNHAQVRFTPVSSVVDEGTFVSVPSLDYGPSTVRNSRGHIVAIYSDGTSVNNGRLFVRTSTDDGRTWSGRTILHGTSGIVDSAIGAGFEVYVVVDRNNRLHFVGHKLLAGATSTIYSQIDISDVANVATFGNWRDAEDNPPPSSGGAVDDQGYDNLGGYIDPSVAVLRSGDVWVAATQDGAGGNDELCRYRAIVGWTCFTHSWSGSTNGAEDLSMLVSDSADRLHLFARITVGGSTHIAYKTCETRRVECTISGQWTGADGSAAFDYVVSSSATGFGFPHPVVDAGSTVHVVAGSSNLIAGNVRAFHNYRTPDSPTWANGGSQNSAGTEINSAGTYPTRTRLIDTDRFGIEADGLRNVYLFYQDQSTNYQGYHVLSESTRTWGDHTVIKVGNGRVADLHSKGGVASVDVFESFGTVLDAVQFQTIPTASQTSQPWWDAPPPPPPPDDVASIVVSVQCSGNGLTGGVSCGDSTRYGISSVDRIEWYVDGALVAISEPNAPVALPLGDSPFEIGRTEHQITMMVVFANGGRQAEHFVVSVDYSPRLLVFLLLLITVTVIVARRIVRRGAG